MRFIAKLFASITLGVFLLLAVLLIILRTHSLSANFAAPLLKGFLKESIAVSNVSIGDTKWSLPSWNALLRVEFQDIEIGFQESKGTLKIPTTKISLNLGALFTKKAVIQEVTVPQFQFDSETIHVKLKGNVSVKISALKSLQIDSKDCEIAAKDILAAPLTLQSLCVLADYSTNVLILRELKLKPKDSATEAKMTGKVTLPVPGGANDSKTLFSFKGTASEVLLDNLSALWALPLGPKIRHWVTTNIKNGTVTEASCEGNGYIEGPKVTLQKLEGMMKGTDIVVHYLGKLPPIEKVSGNVRFNREQFFIEGHGQVQGLKGETKNLLEVLGATILITECDKIDQFIDVKLKIKGDVRKKLELINCPPLSLMQKIGILPEKTGGLALTDVHLRFPLEIKTTPEQVEVKVVSKISEGSFASVGQFPLQFTKGTFDLEADRTQLSLKGQSTLFGTPVTVSWKEVFAPKKDSVKREFKLLGTVGTSFFKNCGLNVTPYFKHKAKIDGTYRLLENRTVEADGKVDLTSTEVSLPILEWTKAGKTPAKISFKVKEQPQGFTATFHATGEEVEAKASGVWKTQNASKSPLLTRFSVDSLRLGPNKLKGTLSRHPLKSGKSDDLMPDFDVNLSGEFLDLSAPIKVLLDTAPPAQRPEPLPNLYLTFQLDEVKLSPNLTLYSPKGTILLAKDRFMMSDVQGFSKTKTLEKQQKYKPFSFQMAPSDSSKEQFFFKSEEAGTFLELLYPSGQITGGTLKIKGEKNASRSEVSGEMTIQDFKVTKAPLLARILSAISPTGVFHLLTGQGLTFDKGTIIFLLNKESLTLKTLRFSNPTIALLVEGELHYQTGLASFSGELFPFYWLNSFLAHIPLLGNVLAGKDQEGVWGASFTLKGPKDKLALSVNPLSPFTPRSLRKAFQQQKRDQALTQTDRGSTQMPHSP